MQAAAADRVVGQVFTINMQAEQAAMRKDIAKRKTQEAAATCLGLGQKRQKLYTSLSSSQGLRSSTHLPDEVWRAILEKVCPAVLSELVSPSVVARDIANAQLVCHDFHAAGTAAWHALEDLVQNTPEFNFMFPLNHYQGVPWDKIVCNPMACQKIVLKYVSRALRQPVSGTKPVLMLQLLTYFNLTQPASVSARLLLAVQQERHRMVETSASLAFKAALVATQPAASVLQRHFLSMFEARKTLYPTMSTLPDISTPTSRDYEGSSSDMDSMAEGSCEAMSTLSREYEYDDDGHVCCPDCGDPHCPGGWM